MTNLKKNIDCEGKIMTGEEAKNMLLSAPEIKAPKNDKGITLIKFNKISELSVTHADPGFFGLHSHKAFYTIKGEIEVYCGDKKEVMKKVSISDDNFRVLLDNIEKEKKV